jgi:hypothetical protein
MRSIKVSKSLCAAVLLLSVSASAPALAADDLQPRSEFGVYFQATPGVAGPLMNPSVQLSPGLSFATGHFVRYHLLAGYSRLGDLNGIDIMPLMLGLYFEVARGSNVSFAIEPLLNVIETEGYFLPGGSLWVFESGVGVQGVLNIGNFFLAIAPLNLNFRYAVVGTSSSSLSAGTGFGLNMPIRGTLGFRF